MNTTNKIWFAIILLALSILTLYYANIRDNKRMEKYDICLTKAITTNTDPNETDIRSKILKECIDK